MNIGSVDGHTVGPFDNFAYSTGKAALHQLTRVLAIELLTSPKRRRAVRAKRVMGMVLGGVGQMTRRAFRTWSRTAHQGA